MYEGGLLMLHLWSICLQIVNTQCLMILAVIFNRQIIPTGCHNILAVSGACMGGEG